MVSKVRIRVGQIEVDFEGDEQFLKDEVPALLDRVLRLHHEAKCHAGVVVEEQLPDSAQGNGTTGIGTTANIAARLGCNSGPDLILAAGARLTLGAGQESLSRQALHEEMKTATAYYKKTYANNLTSYLSNLVKSGRLVESAKDTYALKASTRAEIEAKLAA